MEKKRLIGITILAVLIIIIGILRLIYAINPLLFKSLHIILRTVLFIPTPSEGLFNFLGTEIIVSGIYIILGIFIFLLNNLIRKVFIFLQILSLLSKLWAIVLVLASYPTLRNEGMTTFSYTCTQIYLIVLKCFLPIIYIYYF